jgi:hypothetical protein
MEPKSAPSTARPGAKSRPKQVKEKSETARLFLDVDELSRRSQSASPSRYVE